MLDAITPHRPGLPVLFFYRTHQYDQDQAAQRRT